MFAAVLHDTKKLKVEDVPMPSCGDDDIIIKVRACGICGSDLRNIEHGNARIKFPAILGHEISGEIFQKGKNIYSFNIGDRVALGADIPCNSCHYCLEGNCNHCHENFAIGHQYPGGFAQYIKVDKNVWDKGPFVFLPDTVSFEDAALAEPFACAINGIEKLPNKSKETLVIIGAGVLGSIFAQLGKVFGYKKIYLIDKGKKKLLFIQSQGIIADDFFIFEENVADKINNVTNGKGADAVIVACSALEAQDLSLKIVGKGGAINFFAGLPKTTKPTPISINDIHYNQISLVGSHGSTPRQFSKAIQFIADKKIKPNQLITHRVSLNNISDAFGIANNSDQRLKILVIPN